MVKFWSNLKLLVHPTTLEKHRQQWSGAGCDMSTALKAYDDAWLRITADSESMHETLEAWIETEFLSFNASGEHEAARVRNDRFLEEFFNAQTSACPHVVSLQPEIDEGTLVWLTSTYLWDRVAQYGYFDDGRRWCQSDRVYTAAEKFEELIMETHARRVRHCRDPARDILKDNDVKRMLKERKEEYRVWMRPEALRSTEAMSPQQWHQYLRTAFRAHLFHFVGCYEMTVCFLIAPLNSNTLKIFQLAAEETAHLSHDTNGSQACIDRFTTLGREAVAAPATRNASLCPPRLLETRHKRRLPSRTCSPGRDCSYVWQ